MIDVSEALDFFVQSLTFKKSTQTIVNYVPTTTYETVIKNGVIYPSKSDDLKSLIIDNTLAYYTVYAYDVLSANDLLIFKTKEYKLLSKQDFSDYGYYLYIFEEVKNAN